MNNKALPVVIAIIKNGNRYLLTKQAKGIHCGLWGFPGGKIEAGETPEIALKREIREELGISIKIKNLLGIWVVKNDNLILKKQFPLVAVSAFLCQNIKGKEIKIGDDVGEFAWTEWNNFKRYPLRPAIKLIVDDPQMISQYSV